MEERRKPILGRVVPGDTGPDPQAGGGTKVFRVEVGQLHIGPIEQARPFGPVARREADRRPGRHG